MARPTMRAARYYGKEDIRIEQIPEDDTGPGQIKIAPAYVGICGTDLHEYLGGPNFAPTEPHPVTKDTIPITFGHEFSGTVKELGEGVTGFEVGQKVVVQPTVYCSTCGACRNGIENACYNGGFIGLSGGGGGLSDAVVVPARAVLALPENVPLDIGALVEPLSVAWHAVEAAGATLTADSTVLVLGGGPIGLAVVQCLSARKTKKIIVSEVATQRQRFAKEFGAHHVLDPKTYDLVALSRQLSGGDGPDVVFDCAGVEASLNTACGAVAARGLIINVAIWERPVPFQPNLLVWKEAKYGAVLGYQRKDFEAVIEQLASGGIKPAQMITGRIAMEDLVEHGFRPLIENKEKEVKILVDVARKTRAADEAEAEGAGLSKVDSARG
ncbi:chaperonin 10-like protein [Phyllosticta capitalensis]